jgi:hypothetical protein
MTKEERKRAFEILAEERIKANNECRGCKSFVDDPPRYQVYKKTWSCQFALSGWPDIPNCPCKDCLLKSSCGEECSEFTRVFKISKMVEAWTLC